MSRNIGSNSLDYKGTEKTFTDSFVFGPLTGELFKCRDFLRLYKRNSVSQCYPKKNYIQDIKKKNMRRRLDMKMTSSCNKKSRSQ